jgi:hypothetical protein
MGQVLTQRPQPVHFSSSTMISEKVVRRGNIISFNVSRMLFADPRLLWGKLTGNPEWSFNGSNQAFTDSKVNQILSGFYFRFSHIILY